MKSIKRKLQTILNTLLFASCLLVGIIAVTMGVLMLKETVERDLKAVAQQVTHSIDLAIQGELNTLETIAAREDIQDPKIPMKEKLQFLAKEAERLGAIRISFVDTKGIIHYADGNTNDVSQREYFPLAMNGQSYISEPMINIKEGSVVMLYAAPVSYEGKVVGFLLQSIDGYKLSEIVNGQQFGKTGIGFLVNEEGTVIAHDTRDWVKESYNPKEDTENQAFAKVVEKMISGQVGVANYKAGSSSKDGKFVGYAPVKVKPWFVGVEIDKSEVYESMNTLFSRIILAILALNIVGMVIGTFVAKSIAEKITSTAEHLEKVASGDLTEPVPVKNTKLRDEIGLMSKAMQVMQDSIATIVQAIMSNSNELGSKSEELSVTSNEIAKLSNTITLAISEISEGISHQSNELVSITSVLNQFNGKLESLQSKIEQVDGTSRKIDDMAVKSSQEMNELNASVAKIGDTFNTFEQSISHLDGNIKEINNITRLINDVAAQTNLLALNASIEAARAGEAGKGFAVVVEEIGSLAEQSRSSSQSVNTLISGISEEIQVLVSDAGEIGKELNEQVETINRAISTFSTIIEEVNEMTPMIQSVRESGNEIEEDKNHILNKIDELSAVSEEICASSEKITASTTEMNQSITYVADSASVLNDMTSGMIEQVNRFKV